MRRACGRPRLFSVPSLAKQIECENGGGFRGRAPSTLAQALRGRHEEVASAAVLEPVYARALTLSSQPPAGAAGIAASRTDNVAASLQLVVCRAFTRETRGFQAFHSESPQSTGFPSAREITDTLHATAPNHARHNNETRRPAGPAPHERRPHRRGQDQVAPDGLH